MPLNPSTQPKIIPGDREDGSSSFVHLAIITSGKIGSIPPIALIPLWIGLFTLTYHFWQQYWFFITFVSVLILCIDSLCLWLLPVMNRSWGPITPSLLALTLVRVLFRLLCSLFQIELFGLILSISIDLGISIISYYATWIEPFTIHVTRRTQQVPKSMLAQECRILHISDIHYEGDSPRETHLLKIIKAEKPDVIVLTGDYLNLSSVFDSTAQDGVKKLLSHLHAPLGVYAVTGSPAVDHSGVVPVIFNDLSIEWLLDRTFRLPLKGSNVWLMGVMNTYDSDRDALALYQQTNHLPAESFNLLLYHTPDLMPIARELEVNLYLCGHTHGGQISLPVYGAIFTSSKYGKRYERGMHCENDTCLYVSRGLGVEGMGAPRARFCSSPEVIIWTLKPKNV